MLKAPRDYLRFSGPKGLAEGPLSDSEDVTESAVESEDSESSDMEEVLDSSFVSSVLARASISATMAKRVRAMTTTAFILVFSDPYFFCFDGLFQYRFA